MIKGIIIGHGDFARTLLDTAERILGRQEMVEVISNTNLSCESLTQMIKEKLPKNSKEVIIFVDLPGGSCAISCMNLMKENRELNIICGVNLPILIEFFLLREKYSVAELIPILIKKGRDNITQIGGKSGNAG
ncbi:MAG: PTS mannose transporter subunit IID [candidate division WOR-3 bacterium]